MRRILSGIVPAAIAWCLPAWAQDQGAVYDPLPPQGSAYVRFVNATGEPVAVRPDFLPAQTLPAVETGRITPYAVVEHVDGRPLGLTVQQGAHTSTAVLHAAPGGFLTVLVEPGATPAIVPVTDQTDFNQSRARLSFYNAVPGCAAAKLALAAGDAAVFQDVAPGAAKARSVNPVEAPVRVFCAGQPAATLTLGGMEAGGMYSVWLMQPGPTATAFLARDATAKWKR